MEKPVINKEIVKDKAKDVWKVLTETEMEMNMKFTVTPLGVIAFAAGIAATAGVIHCVHKRDIKRALRKQAKTLKAETKVKVAEAKAKATKANVVKVVKEVKEVKEAPEAVEAE